MTTNKKYVKFPFYPKSDKKTFAQSYNTIDFSSCYCKSYLSMHLQFYTKKVLSKLCRIQRETHCTSVQQSWC